MKIISKIKKTILLDTPHIFKTLCFSLQLPTGWSEFIEKETDKVNQRFWQFISSKGDGALQISIWDKKPDSDPYDFLDSHLFWDFKRKSVPIKKYERDGLTVAESEFMSNNKRLKGHWQLMAIANERWFAYLTYNCNESERSENEMTEAKEIMNSFTLEN